MLVSFSGIEKNEGRKGFRLVPPEDQADIVTGLTKDFTSGPPWSLISSMIERLMGDFSLMGLSPRST